MVDYDFSTYTKDDIIETLLHGYDSMPELSSEEVLVIASLKHRWLDIIRDENLEV